jgi:hypothetical protein
MLTAKERLELAVKGIMEIVNAVGNAKGSGGEYDGNPKHEIRLILRELLKGPYHSPIEPSDKPSDDGC